MTKPLLPVILLLLLLPPAALGQDMREASRKAAEDRARAEQAAQASQERILQDRRALVEEVTRLEARERELQGSVEALRGSIEARTAQEEALAETWAQKEFQFRETVGTVRESARELESILSHSPFTVFLPERVDRLQPLLNKNYFPGIEEINLLTDLYFDEAARSGQVSLQKGDLVDRRGTRREGEILTVGKFTTVYDTGDEVGFLARSDDANRFYALSELPPWHVRRNLRKYMQGQEGVVYTDLSGGAATRQITRSASLWDQIRSGGPIVWPILAIALFAAGLILERFIFLRRVHGNTDRIMASINEMADRGDWQGCEETVNRYRNRNWPVIHVLSAGLAARSEDRETQENILEEAILREAPRLERFLAVLGILGAIAPLLGLLGTVTGMISTFRVITLYGTGDPKMMSGGISEALVTTELGLAVAIPIMLLHTFLTRRVDRIVADMEEKAVALTNISQKARLVAAT